MANLLNNNYYCSQLQKLHKQFFYLAMSKIINLYRYKQPDKAYNSTRQIHDWKSASHNHFKRIQWGSKQSRVPHDVGDEAFNDLFLIVILYIDANFVLYVNNDSSIGSNASFSSYAIINHLFKNYLKNATRLLVLNIHLIF